MSPLFIERDTYLLRDEIQTIQEGQTRVIQGLSIRVLDSFYDEDRAQRSADLRIVPYSSGGGSPLRIKTQTI